MVRRGGTQHKHFTSLHLTSHLSLIVFRITVNYFSSKNGQNFYFFLSLSLSLSL